MFSFHAVDCDTYHLPLPLFYHQKMSQGTYFLRHRASIHFYHHVCSFLIFHLNSWCVCVFACMGVVNPCAYACGDQSLTYGCLPQWLCYHIFFETGFLSESEVYLFNLSGCLVSSWVHLSLPSALRTVVTDMCNHEHSILCGTVSAVPTELSP